MTSYLSLGQIHVAEVAVTNGVAQSQDDFVVGAYGIRLSRRLLRTGTLLGASLAALQEFCHKTGVTVVIPKWCNAVTN